MDWLKFALDRLFGFLAVLIPGSAVLLLFMLHRPDLIAHLWRAVHLSYETKIAISVLFTFAMGWTVSSGLASLLGAFGGGLGGLLKANEPETRPWQNENWRALLTNYLGKAAPENVPPVSNLLFEKRLELLRLNPEEKWGPLAVDLMGEKVRAELNDFQWRTWWDHFHHMSFTKLEPVDAMASTLTINFQAASLVLLCAMPFSPPLRTWWLITACLFWTVLLIVQSATIIMRARDPWSSFTDQMERLQSGMGDQRIALKDKQGRMSPHKGEATCHPRQMLPTPQKLVAVAMVRLQIGFRILTAPFRDASVAEVRAASLLHSQLESALHVLQQVRCATREALAFASFAMGRLGLIVGIPQGDNERANFLAFGRLTMVASASW